jgi:hypothetical protein
MSHSLDLTDAEFVCHQATANPPGHEDACHNERRNAKFPLPQFEIVAHERALAPVLAAIDHSVVQALCLVPDFQQLLLLASSGCGYDFSPQSD